MTQMSKRQRRRDQQRRARLRSRIVFGGIGIAVLAIVGALIWSAVRPAAGEAKALMPADHVPEGIDPGPYNTDPPTSGPHYPDSLEAGFYHQSDLETLPDYPVGYLVHNLEHGYVIFWYNCALVDERDCQDLKSQIGGVMERFEGVKVIAFPWETLDVPVVMTSWGRMQRMETFDTNAAIRFVDRNRNRAPEPQAP
jgi:hypothetical protein